MNSRVLISAILFAFDKTQGWLEAEGLRLSAAGANAVSFA